MAAIIAPSRVALPEWGGGSSLLGLEVPRGRVLEFKGRSGVESRSFLEGGRSVGDIDGAIRIRGVLRTWWRARV